MVCWGEGREGRIGDVLLLSVVGEKHQLWCNAYQRSVGAENTNQDVKTPSTA